MHSKGFGHSHGSLSPHGDSLLLTPGVRVRVRVGVRVRVRVRVKVRVRIRVRVRVRVTSLHIRHPILTLLF
jgi:hypothetical protein